MRNELATFASNPSIASFLNMLQRFTAPITLFVLTAMSTVGDAQPDPISVQKREINQVFHAYVSACKKSDAVMWFDSMSPELQREELLQLCQRDSLFEDEKFRKTIRPFCNVNEIIRINQAIDLEFQAFLTDFEAIDEYEKKLLACVTDKKSLAIELFKKRYADADLPGEFSDVRRVVINDGKATGWSTVTHTGDSEIEKLELELAFKKVDSKWRIHQLTEHFSK